MTVKVTIDCRDSMDAIHAQLARELAFPDWYGKNLDALHDCLTERKDPVEFTLLHPEERPVLVRVLKDAAEENPNICICM
jgi:ribonuclease inhibitor